MELQDVLKLGATLSAVEAADLLGVGVDHLYKMERAGECPVPALHLGRKLRWPTIPVLEAIGFDRETITKWAAMDLCTVCGRTSDDHGL